MHEMEYIPGYTSIFTGILLITEILWEKGVEISKPPYRKPLLLAGALIAAGLGMQYCVSHVENTTMNPLEAEVQQFGLNSDTGAYELENLNLQ